MSGTRAGRWWKRGVWAGLAVVLAAGCNPLTTIAFLTHRDDPVPAPYRLRPKEGEKAAKDHEIKVLVLCDHGSGMTFEFAGADRELAGLLTKRLPELAKENKEKLTVVPPADLDKFKWKNPDWKTMRPARIGKALGADYVLDVGVGNVNVYQPGSGRKIYEGRAEVEVDVYDVAAPAADGPAHHYTHQFVFPKTGMKVVEDIPLSLFRQMFLEKLALELSRKHVDYKQAALVGADQ